MLVKIIGGLCIFASTTYIGFGQSIMLKKREKYLLNIKAFLNLLEVEIQFSANRLKKILIHIEKNISLDGLLTSVAENLEKDGIQKSWEKGVKEKCKCLNKDDIEILLMLGAELGMTDRENQIKNIKHIKKLIEKQYEVAQAKHTQLSKLYEGCGVLAGLFAVVLLF